MNFQTLILLVTVTLAQLKCIGKCGGQMAACGLNNECRKYLGCSKGCMDNWDKDPTPQKYHAQNCTTTCAASYVMRE
jgi:hypothetical protein